MRIWLLLMGTSQHGWTIPLAASRSDAVAYTVIVSGATVSLGEEAYWSEIAGDAMTLSISQRDQLTEQMAAYDGERGFDPRPSIEAMTIPGLAQSAISFQPSEKPLRNKSLR